MNLYYHPLCTYSQKVLLACYEKGITFRPRVVDLQDPAQRRAYSEIYPLERTPLLVTDQDVKIPESSIIIEYFEDTYSDAPRLIPDAKDEARQVRFRDRMHDFYLNEPVVALLKEMQKPNNEQNPLLINKSRRTLDIIYEFLNSELSNHSWSNGENFSMADCAAAPPLYFAQRIHSFNKYPPIKAYFSRLMGRASFQKVAREAEPFMKRFLQ